MTIIDRVKTVDIPVTGHLFYLYALIFKSPGGMVLIHVAQVL